MGKEIKGEKEKKSHKRYTGEERERSRQTDRQVDMQSGWQAG